MLQCWYSKQLNDSCSSGKIEKISSFVKLLFLSDKKTLNVKNLKLQCGEWRKEKGCRINIHKRPARSIPTRPTPLCLPGDALKDERERTNDRNKHGVLLERIHGYDLFSDIFTELLARTFCCCCVFIVRLFPAPSLAISIKLRDIDEGRDEVQKCSFITTIMKANFDCCCCCWDFKFKYCLKKQR